MCNMLGLGDMNADQLASKLEETLPVIRSVSEQFKDPVSHSFFTRVSECNVGGLQNNEQQIVVIWKRKVHTYIL